MDTHFTIALKWFYPIRRGRYASRSQKLPIYLTIRIQSWSKNEFHLMTMIRTGCKFAYVRKMWTSPKRNFSDFSILKWNILNSYTCNFVSKIYIHPVFIQSSNRIKAFFRSFSNVREFEISLEHVKMSLKVNLEAYMNHF